IGRVVELKPVYKPSLHFLATMRIKKDIELYENCTALILNQNIIGDTVIEIRNPDIKGAPLLDGDVIEGLEYVNLEAILTDVHKLLNTVTETVVIMKDLSLGSRENILGLLSDLRTSVAGVNSILADSQKDIPAILQSLRNTAALAQEIAKEFKERPIGFMLKGKKEEEEK
ncbi:MAG: hypothetical protein KBG49_06220, partial [Spirochaetes bacterium]|nr:hypothetical protein [Spirochaetota bacterium]